MIIKLYVSIVIFIIIGLFILFSFIINEIKKGRYNVNDESVLSQEAENRYEILHPNNSINDLKDEIEKVAELLILGEESNRYTEILRQKAKQDERIQDISNAIIENVELLKYVNDILKARIKYKDYENEYTLVLTFSTVTAGRVFLNDYFIFKNKIVFEDAS